MQWIALAILTVGCIIQRLSFSDDPVKTNRNLGSQNIQHSQDLKDLLLYVLSKTEILWIFLQVSI